MNVDQAVNLAGNAGTGLGGRRTRRSRSRKE